MNTASKRVQGHMSRRSLIRRGLALTAGSALVPGIIASGNDRLNLPDPHVAYALPEDHWANLVDHKFRVKGLSFGASAKHFRRTTLVLLETCQCIPRKEDSARPLWLKKFGTSLLFQGPSHFLLEDQSYKLEHRWLGEFDLLLSHNDLDKYARENVYEAIINN